MTWILNIYLLNTSWTFQVEVMGEGVPDIDNKAIRTDTS